MSFKNNHFIRVTKQFTFDMAHALYGYDGPCKNIHGHTYKLSVTLKGKVIENPNHPKNGMVIDFTDFKRIVADNIVSVFDHSLVLNSKAPYGDLKNLNENFPTMRHTSLHKESSTNKGSSWATMAAKPPAPAMPMPAPAPAMLMPAIMPAIMQEDDYFARPKDESNSWF